MKERKVNLTNEAFYDLRDIEDYISSNFSDKEVENFQKKMDETIEKVSLIGGVFGNTCLKYRDFIIYKYPIKPSIIFYIIIDDEIYILRVLREEMDWKNIITKSIKYHD